MHIMKKKTEVWLHYIKYHHQTMLKENNEEKDDEVYEKIPSFCKGARGRTTSCAAKEAQVCLKEL